jgi:predicted lactoylglutathione lyase
MEPRLDVITLAVADLERALAFYRALGLESAGIIGTEWTDAKTGANGAIAMFKLAGGLMLNLYARADLAKDAAIPERPPQSGEFSLAQLVGSREEVDALLRKAASAGGRVTPAHDRPWGIYSGYFRDLDGHLWEIAWNPKQ